VVVVVVVVVVATVVVVIVVVVVVVVVVVATVVVVIVVVVVVVVVVGVLQLRNVWGKISLHFLFKFWQVNSIKHKYNIKIVHFVIFPSLPEVFIRHK